MTLKFAIAAGLLLGFATASAAQCPVSEIEKALTAPLQDLSLSEHPVEDIQSTEGGVWRVYRRADGTLHSIIRIDAGESGMSERRLSIHGNAEYGIAVTRVDYLRHAFVDDGGPNGTARRSTEYFYFCDGKLHLPAEQYATMDGAAYAESGEAARDAMLGAALVANAAKQLKR